MYFNKDLIIRIIYITIDNKKLILNLLKYHLLNFIIFYCIFSTIDLTIYILNISHFDIFKSIVHFINNKFYIDENNM